jgi:hypothetical protein
MKFHEEFNVYEELWNEPKNVLKESAHPRGQRQRVSVKEHRSPAVIQNEIVRLLEELKEATVAEKGTEYIYIWEIYSNGGNLAKEPGTDKYWKSAQSSYFNGDLIYNSGKVFKDKKEADTDAYNVLEKFADEGKIRFDDYSIHVYKTFASNVNKDVLAKSGLSHLTGYNYNR